MLVFLPQIFFTHIHFKLPPTYIQMTTSNDIEAKNFLKPNFVILPPKETTFTGPEGSGKFFRGDMKYNFGAPGQPAVLLECTVQFPKMRSERGLHTIQAKKKDDSKDNKNSSRQSQRTPSNNNDMIMQMVKAGHISPQQAMQMMQQANAIKKDNPMPEVKLEDKPKEKKKKFVLDGIPLTKEGADETKAVHNAVYEVSMEYLLKNADKFPALKDSKDEEKPIVARTLMKKPWYIPNEGAPAQYTFNDDRYTSYVFPDDSPIEKDDLQGKIFEFTPRVKFFWLYMGGKNVSIQEFLVSATIDPSTLIDQKEKTKPTELNKKIREADPEIVAKSKAALARLQAAKNNSKNPGKPDAKAETKVETLQPEIPNTIAPANSEPTQMAKLELPALPQITTPVFPPAMATTQLPGNLTSDQLMAFLQSQASN